MKASSDEIIWSACFENNFELISVFWTFGYTIISSVQKSRHHWIFKFQHLNVFTSNLEYLCPVFMHASGMHGHFNLGIQYSICNYKAHRLFIINKMNKTLANFWILYFFWLILHAWYVYEYRWKWLSMQIHWSNIMPLNTIMIYQ